MSIASEPHTPWAHERRKVSVPSCSYFTLWRRSRTRSIGSDWTVYASQCAAVSRSGSKRRMRSSTCIVVPGTSVRPRLRLEAGDRHRLVAKRRPALTPEGEAVGEEVDVVALGVVLPVVGAPALPARKGGRDGRLGAVEQVAELARLEQVRVERPPPVLDRDPPIPLAQPTDRRLRLREERLVAEDPDLVHHHVGQLAPEVGRALPGRSSGDRGQLGAHGLV